VTIRVRQAALGHKSSVQLRPSSCTRRYARGGYQGFKAGSNPNTPKVSPTSPRLLPDPICSAASSFPFPYKLVGHLFALLCGTPCRKSVPPGPQWISVDGPSLRQDLADSVALCGSCRGQAVISRGPRVENEGSLCVCQGRFRVSVVVARESSVRALCKLCGALW